MHSKWFVEFTTENEASFHAVEDVIHSSQTEFQKLEILRLGSYGKCLILDGKIQSTEADEFIYHESLVHPGLIALDSPSSVLIAGGGEGATIREVLRHPSVREVILIDLDPRVVAECKEHLPEWHQGAFDDPRVTVVFEDARKYIETSERTYDLVILDLPEPFESGPASLLYTKEFYQNIFDRLSGTGAMVSQATSTAVHNSLSFLIINNTIREVFPIVRPYSANIPSYYSPWGFVYAAKKNDLLLIKNKELKERIGALKGLRFYDREVHQGLFILPRFLREALEKEDRVNTDSAPLSFY